MPAEFPFYFIFILFCNHIFRKKKTESQISLWSKSLLTDMSQMLTVKDSDSFAAKKRFWRNSRYLERRWETLNDSLIQDTLEIPDLPTSKALWCLGRNPKFKVQIFLEKKTVHEYKISALSPTLLRCSVGGSAASRSSRPFMNWILLFYPYNRETRMFTLS